MTAKFAKFKNTTTWFDWNIVFNNGPSQICGIQPLINLK